MGYPLIILPPNLVLEGPPSPESFRSFNLVDRFLLVAVLLSSLPLQIWERVAEVWNGIEPEVCQGLIESMPRRLEAVIKAKGGNTKY
jgi:hypothetical protein